MRIRPASVLYIERLTSISMPNFKQDWTSSLMIGEGGGFSTASPNSLPNKFTDDSILTIMIPVKDYEDVDAQVIQPEQRKGSWLSRRLSAQSGRTGGKSGFKSVKMTRGEYLKYWAKGEDGKYSPEVVEPPEGRKAWVMKKLETQ